jgi:hypothetical protein
MRVMSHQSIRVFERFKIDSQQEDSANKFDWHSLIYLKQQEALHMDLSATK